MVAAFVVASHHKGNSPRILRTLKGFEHNAKACIVLPISGCFIGLNRGGVALCRGAIALLFHVGSAHELYSVVVAIGLGMRQIFLKLGNPPHSVALYRRHYHGLVTVEFLHCLAGKTVDGSLNPGLFGIDHQGPPCLGSKMGHAPYSRADLLQGLLVLWAKLAPS